jgi:protein FAM32A
MVGGCRSRKTSLSLFRMAKDDDYASMGGTLKLKGVKDAKIDKKRKKKKQPKAEGNNDDLAGSSSAEASGDRLAATNEENEIQPERKANEKSSDGKTQAERRHEEMRRKRVSVTCQLQSEHLLREFARTFIPRVDIGFSQRGKERRKQESTH